MVTNLTREESTLIADQMVDVNRVGIGVLRYIIKIAPGEYHHAEYLL